MPVALLDMNVLIALFDPDHVHHEPAHRWFATNRENGWATCPLTENGLVRILANTGYSGVRDSPGAIRARLGSFCESGQHSFWPDSLSLREHRFDLKGLSPNQITDAYLLGLAAERRGRLATFDRRIPIRAVANGGADALLVIPA